MLLEKKLLKLSRMSSGKMIMTTRRSAWNLQRLNEPALCDTEQRNINSSTNMQVVSGTERNSQVRLVQRAHGTEINSPNPNDGDVCVCVCVFFLFVLSSMALSTAKVMSSQSITH